MNLQKSWKFCACSVFLVLSFIYLRNLISIRSILASKKTCDDAISFEGFNNETGTSNGCYIVPNYIHFLRFDLKEVSFSEAVCILAAFKAQKPHKLFIHSNTKLEGKYWNITLSTPGLKEVLILNPISKPKEIYGQRLSPKWQKYHGGDVARLRILMQYGGIFLDNDSYLVRSLDDYRRFEMSIGWVPGKSLQNQVIVAHKNARFLKLWLGCYKDYKSNLWYYNAGELPTKTILDHKPWLVHREEILFGVYGIVRKVFQTLWPDWRNYYAIHLQIRHQYLLKNISSVATYPVTFNEENIHNYPIAFRDMVYEVFPFTGTHSIIHYSHEQSPLKLNEMNYDY